MYGYIYMIVNKVNGKTYVGKRKSIDFHDKYMGSGSLLYKAKKKYGIENFEKFLICYTDSEKDAQEKEVFWIAEYKKRGKAEYNICKGGQGGCGGPTMLGKHMSAESREKMSKAHKGQKNYWITHEVAMRGAETRRKNGFQPWDKGMKGHYPYTCWAKGKKYHTNKHWYTNGDVELQAYECPEGYVPGRAPKVRNAISKTKFSHSEEK